MLELSTGNISWGVKAASAQGLQPYHPHVPTVLKSGSLNLLAPLGPVQACNGIALPLPLPLLCWQFQFTALFFGIAPDQILFLSFSPNSNFSECLFCTLWCGMIDYAQVLSVMFCLSFRLQVWRLKFTIQPDTKEDMVVLQLKNQKLQKFTQASQMFSITHFATLEF